jgi:hypothetical protein
VAAGEPLGERGQAAELVRIAAQAE